MKYRANFSSLFWSFLLLNAIAILVEVFKSNAIEYANLILMNTLLLLLIFLRRNVLYLSFDKEKIQIKYFRFFKASTESYYYHELSFAEVDSLLGRGNRGSVLTLYADKKVVFALNPSTSGFSANTISEIHQSLMENNIRHCNASG